jgi:hypothetical protein
VLVWNNQMKIQSPSLVYNHPKNTKRSHLIQDIKMVKAKVVSKDVGVRENGARMCVVQKYFLTCLMTKLWKSRL